MVRGSRKKFKQPVAFYLTNGNMDSTHLSIIIKEVIKAVQLTGLTVVYTVCDQAPTNVAAINRLLKETNEKYVTEGTQSRRFGFEIGTQDIIPLYDVPHLLKGLRNNLVSKDLHFTYDDKKMIASWKHLIQFYEMDKNQSTGGDRLAPKLTDNHIYPKKMKKMKVSCAAHVFSQRVGAIMKRLPFMLNTSNEECPENKIVQSSIEDTGYLCLFIDNYLFDSANGNTIKPVAGKELRSTVSFNSAHWDFWRKALIVLQSMQYETKTKKVIPSVVNWIKTIKGLQALCTKLLNDGFKYILLRNFNQDPIENFFGSIRSHGVRNIKPMCANFISSFKALLINYFTSSHLFGSNCENDDCDGALDNLKDFLFNDIPIDETNLVDDEINSVSLETPVQEFRHHNILNSNSRAYVTGWVIKKIKKLTKNCNYRMENITSHQMLKEHMVIQIRQYDNCNLNYLNEVAMDIFNYLIEIFNLNFDKFVYKCNSKTSFNYLITNFIPSSYLTCPIHDLFNMFLKTTTNLLIYSYITHTNRILTKGEKSVTSDQIKNNAMVYHDKYAKKINVLLRQNVNYV